MQDDRLLPGPDHEADAAASGKDALEEGEDFYYEGSALVFTANYHLKRGVCCHSGCRHCPYTDSRDGAP